MNKKDLEKFKHRQFRATSQLADQLDKIAKKYSLSEFEVAGAIEVLRMTVVLRNAEALLKKEE